MSQSEQINELAKALCKCQSEMTFAVKDSLNPHFKSRYADLSAVWDAIRTPLTANGLSISQTMGIASDGRTVMISILMHISGQWIKSEIPVINEKNTCQSQGSGITYARRYALAALVGCVQDDDDGNEATSKPIEKKEKPKKESPEILTDEQKKIMNSLADQCDPDYIAKVFTRLEQKGIYGFEGVTQDLYELIIGGMKKNIEVYKGK